MEKIDYVAQMETQLKKWDADVDALAAAGDKANEAARASYTQTVKSLRENRKAAAKTFQDLQAASKEAGEKMQATMTASWEAMQKSLEKAASSLRK